MEEAQGRCESARHPIAYRLESQAADASAEG